VVSNRDAFLIDEDGYYKSSIAGRTMYITGRECLPYEVERVII